MRKFLMVFLFLIVSQIVLSQKMITLQECESQFLKNNLTLLAAQFNIDASKAATMQAKIWDNPTISGDVNFYNPENGNYFDVGKQGQKAFGIQQLIYMGGKKRNGIKLAQTGEKIAEFQFADLLRTLKLQLRKSFYNAYFISKNIETSDKQIIHIEDLINNYTIQTAKGNVPLKELVRLQSLFLNIKNERMDLYNSLMDEQANLKLFLATNETIIPKMTESELSKYTKDIAFNAIEFEKTALANRPDYLAKQKAIEANEWNVKLQKSLAIPDVTLGGSYDQHAGAFNDQKNINLSLPLPLWNKNKGNIKLSQAILEQSKFDEQNFHLQIQSEISSSWNKWSEARKNYLKISPSTKSDFETVYNGILLNFQKRNISLLEFTDFMESYNQGNIQLNEIMKKLAISAEELNSTITKELF